MKRKKLYPDECPVAEVRQPLREHAVGDHVEIAPSESFRYAESAIGAILFERAELRPLTPAARAVLALVTL